MNPEERIPNSPKPSEQEQVSETRSGALSLSPESEEILEKLRRELADLYDRFELPETRKIPFGEPGGEQSIGKQMVMLQRDKLPQVFKDIVFESPHLSVHNVQKEKYSCQLASVNNVLKALGFEITEKEVAEAVGKSGEFANIWPEELTEYLKSKGLDVSKIRSTLEMIDALIKGGKIVLQLLPPKYPFPHTVVISGIKIDYGKIEFYVNDPQYKNYAEAVSLNDFVDVIVPYSFYKIMSTCAVFKRVVK